LAARLIAGADQLGLSAQTLAITDLPSLYTWLISSCVHAIR